MAKKINNNKKQILSDILNQLININVFEYDTMKDGKNVDYRYNNEKTLNSVIRKCSGLCLQDYPYDIIRDETYASSYESMLKIADDYTEGELILIYKDLSNKSLSITNKFLSRIYKLSVFSVKNNLSGYRKTSTGMVYADMVEYTDDNLNNIFDDTDTENVDLVGFLQWFNENKESFLTKKQLAYLEDESVAVKGNASHYRKRIYEATLKAYKGQFDSEDERVNELQSQINNIEKVLDASDFVQAYKKIIDKHYIIDAITSYVSMNTMKAFNTGDTSKQVIKEYRIALFKKLNQLNQLLESINKKDESEELL